MPPRESRTRISALLHELRGLGAVLVLHKFQVNHGLDGVIEAEVRKDESADEKRRYQVWWNGVLQEIVTKEKMKERFPGVACIQSE